MYKLIIIDPHIPIKWSSQSPFPFTLETFPPVDFKGDFELLQILVHIKATQKLLR